MFAQDAWIPRFPGIGLTLTERDAGMNVSLMRMRVPAKINLHLRVGPRRDDGFHPVCTWMCTVGLYDMLSITRRAAPGAEFSCDQPDLPRDETNLIVRAAAELARESGQTLSGAAITLEKHIPTGAGLGGGSADAAFTLRALNDLWNIHWPVDRLAGFSARIGSDLPFFFHLPSAVCSGRGEIVRPVARPAPGWALLVMPDVNLPTAAVYGRFDAIAGNRPRPPIDQAVPAQWTSLPSEALLAHLVNDLEPAAFSLRPELGQLRADVEQTMSRPVRMTGSGSALFTLFDRRSDSDAAQGQIGRRGALSRRLRCKTVQLAPPEDD